MLDRIRFLETVAREGSAVARYAALDELQKYSEDEARDDHGEWSGGGGLASETQVSAQGKADRHQAKAEYHQAQAAKTSDQNARIAHQQAAQAHEYAATLQQSVARGLGDSKIADSASRDARDASSHASDVASGRATRN